LTVELTVSSSAGTVFIPTTREKVTAFGMPILLSARTTAEGVLVMIRMRAKRKTPDTAIVPAITRISSL
jgi:hypothetical protein